MMTTQQHLSRQSQVQSRIGLREGTGREVEISRISHCNFFVHDSTSLLPIQKNEGLRWR